MTLLANSADPAYQAGYAFGQLLFSLGVTLAIAYGVAQLVKNALRRRRDERNGIRYVSASHVPQPGSAYTSWGGQTPPPTGYTAPTGYQAPATRRVGLTQTGADRCLYADRVPDSLGLHEAE